MWATHQQARLNVGKILIGSKMDKPRMCWCSDPICAHALASQNMHALHMWVPWSISQYNAQVRLTPEDKSLTKWFSYHCLTTNQMAFHKSHGVLSTRYGANISSPKQSQSKSLPNVFSAPQSLIEVHFGKMRAGLDGVFFQMDKICFAGILSMIAEKLGSAWLCCSCFVGNKNSNNLYLQLLCQLCPHRTSIFRGAVSKVISSWAHLVTKPQSQNQSEMRGQKDRAVVVGKRR